MSEQRRKWSTSIHVIDLKNENARVVSKSIDFKAINNVEAKAKVLAILKRVVSRVKNIQDKCVSDMTLPREPRTGEVYVTTDDMIRARDYYRNRRILRIKNPDIALVQGYGSEAWEALGRR
jgi:hypothetical protein